MFQRIRNKASIKFLAKELPKRLVVKYGRKSAYDASEIDWALVAVEKEKDKDKHLYHLAYAMLADKSFYLSLESTSSCGKLDDLYPLFYQTLFNESGEYSVESVIQYSADVSSNTSDANLAPSSLTDVGVGYDNSGGTE
ncbi:hypothetical protein BIY21_20500 [Vibrio ponticus]|uniref:Uncharacterized protein n=1 Tax=Vibrio ponticus TaxID=265668 RepID=A0A3N3E134_9VIBR|nr:hypothetical protein [Vibrio ponticus]OLQ95828.1 hypothetical protein BIY21_20500 [Vibrio ponticus]ROV60329.1 hypothetical protein EGH82_09850 [Vibrio ponticus]